MGSNREKSNIAIAKMTILKGKQKLFRIFGVAIICLPTVVNGWEFLWVEDKSYQLDLNKEISHCKTCIILYNLESKNAL